MHVRRVPMIGIRTAKDWASAAPGATHLVVDVDGTLLPFRGEGRNSEAFERRLRELTADRRLHSVVAVSNAATPWPDRERNERIPVTVVARARKPWTSRRSLDRPCEYASEACRRVVIGDQVLTDGLLAFRLGVPFLRVTARFPGEPTWPRLMRLGGRLLENVLFTNDFRS